MPDHEVVVVGDGPAGAAAAAECRALGIDAVVVGRGRPWPNRYGVWVDEVPLLPNGVFATTRDRVVVVAATRREIARAYGVVDNAGLREYLGLDRHLIRDAMVRLAPHRDHVDVELLDGSPITAGVVVDATGAARGPAPAWQTAYGLIVDADVVRSQFTTEAITLMDWSAREVATFCYVVPLRSGWLVEETALATRAPVPLELLRAKLARRLGEGVVADAEAENRVEHVSIPMGLPITRGSGRIVPFGAAAGMIHPVTGYSLSAALRLAPALAQAIAAETDPFDAVWSPSMRRTRALHDLGLRVLLSLGANPISDFFEAFFSLPVSRWAPYLRIDSSPRDVAAAMRGVFAAAPWSVRRRLVHVGPQLVAQLVRG